MLDIIKQACIRGRLRSAIWLRFARRHTIGRPMDTQTRRQSAGLYARSCKLLSIANNSLLCLNDNGVQHSDRGVRLGSELIEQREAVTVD